MPLRDDYVAIREAAAIGSISPRAQIAVAGADRASYLQGLLTNDIQALTPGAGCYAAWLTPQGRMLTDMHLLASATMILMDIPAPQETPTLERLEQFIFTEDVQVRSLGDAMTGVWLHGPRAPEVLERVFEGARDLAGWDSYRHAQVLFQGEHLSTVRIDQLGVPGFCVYVARGREAALTAAFTREGAVTAGSDALDAARIEAGYPVFGTDMTETTIPLEADIEQRAISFTKGCYVGQEVIIRVLHRGGGRVARKLVALRMQGEVGRGAKIVSGDREIGEITSVADSPRLGSIALGYVHRDFVSPGTHVEVAADARRVTATVTTRPMPSGAG